MFNVEERARLVRPDSWKEGDAIVAKVVRSRVRVRVRVRESGAIQGRGSSLMLL